jgi:1,4-alpha-glucan branching enzyme
MRTPFLFRKKKPVFGIFALIKIYNYDTIYIVELRLYNIYEIRRTAMALEKSYSKDKKFCTVKFIVSAEAAQGVERINLAGDFNSWSATETPMKKEKVGSFSVKQKLEAGKSYQFRYLFDGKRWENEWKADNYIPAPFSNTDNSVVFV